MKKESFVTRNVCLPGCTGVREGRHLQTRSSALRRVQGTWYAISNRHIFEFSNESSIFYISGIFFVLPCIESYQKVDLRTITLGVPPQEVKH